MNNCVFPQPAFFFSVLGCHSNSPSPHFWKIRQRVRVVPWTQLASSSEAVLEAVNLQYSTAGSITDLSNNRGAKWLWFFPASQSFIQSCVCDGVQGWSTEMGILQRAEGLCSLVYVVEGKSCSQVFHKLVFLRPRFLAGKKWGMGGKWTNVESLLLLLPLQFGNMKLEAQNVWSCGRVAGWSGCGTLMCACVNLFLPKRFYFEWFLWPVGERRESASVWTQDKNKMAYSLMSL